MTLNAKIGFLWIFWWFRAARHILRANCAETNWDRHRTAAYEIFSIECRFQRCNSRFFYIKENLRTRASKRGTPIKVVIWPLLASLLWKRLQIGIGMLLSQQALVTSFSVVSRWWLWKTLNFRNKGFLLIFAIFGCSTFWTVTKWMEIGWQFPNRNCYWLSRISWALAQISCSLEAAFQWIS